MEQSRTINRSKDNTQKSLSNIGLEKSRNKEILIEQNNSPTEGTFNPFKETKSKKKFSPSPNYSIDFEKYRIIVLEKLNN